MLPKLSVVAQATRHCPDRVQAMQRRSTIDEVRHRTSRTKTPSPRHLGVKVAARDPRLSTNADEQQNQRYRRPSHSGRPLPDAVGRTQSGAGATCDRSDVCLVETILYAVLPANERVPSGAAPEARGMVGRAIVLLKLGISLEWLRTPRDALKSASQASPAYEAVRPIW